MIQVRQLSKSFGERKVVDAIDLSVAAGETFGILGPNGAGKSTTINMLVGLLSPDEGEISIANGNPIDNRTRQRIGIAPQSLSLYENLSAEDNLRFFGAMYGLRGRQLNDRVRWSLEFSGLVDRAADRVANYSGGMKRRLNIAVGLIHQPQVLLLDEPTVGVDPQSRNHILDSIAQLARDGLTVIYTTHYMEEAERLCDRVAIMDQGRLLANDTTDGILRQFGGQSTVTATVEHCPEHLKLPAELRSGILEFNTSAPIEDLSRLQQQGLICSQIKIDKPNLEGVFLSLTGRSLRD